MRPLFSTFFLSTLFMTVSSFAQTEGTPLALQTKLDPSMKIILESVVSAVIGRFPTVSTKSTFVLNDGTDLASGKVSGDLDLRIVPVAEQAPILSRAQMNVQMLTTVPDGVLIDLKAQGQFVTQDLITALVAWNSELCPEATAATSGCATQLITAEEESLSGSQKAAQALERFKANLLSSLATISSEVAPVGEETFTFGGGDVAPTVTETEGEGDATVPLSPELAQRLSAVIDSGFVISKADSTTTLSIDTQQLKSLGSDFSDSLPALSLLSSFSAIQVAIGDTDTSYSLDVQSKIPSSVVATYDSYLSGEQNGWWGLGGLADLVQKIAPWAAGRCSESENLGYCMDQFLNACARNSGSVSFCIDGARAVQVARDVKGGFESIGGAFGGMFGGGSQEEETKE